MLHQFSSPHFTHPLVVLGHDKTQMYVRRKLVHPWRMSFGNRKIWKNMVPTQGTQSRHADIFSRKREKLNRWVTDVSFPEIDGLCSKGCDIVPVLLKRLVPEFKDINIVNDKKLGQEESDIESQLRPSFESDIYCNRLQWTPRHCPEIECDPYLDDDIPNPLWNRSRGRILLLDAPLHHDNDAPHYYYKPWDFGLHEGELRIDSDSSFVYPVRKHRSVELLEELDEFYQSNRNLVGNQSNAPALDWNYDKEKFGRTLSIISSHDIEPNSHRSSLAWIDDDDNGSFASSNVHINEEPEYSLPMSSSSYHHNHDLRVEILEDQEDIHTLPDSNHLPLTLSRRPNYFGPDEYFYDDTCFPHQDHWSMSKLFSQVHHYPPQTKTLQSSELALSLGWKCFPEENHSSSYLALEYPGESRNQRRDASHYNVFDEFESCLNDSSRRGTLAHFSEDSEDSIRIHDRSSLCYQVSSHYP
ncbi:uncharacterized protein LOC133783665 isoform X2 [Humulus lupulus]|uniref:uncharacterized protein LOC133783665 isoform X2 n=1 Tax=Humulus lupulus TaxID=3486 RepID=UPI002B403F2E|nr:uncharacterized protein LOC133783665 isoform X2 [Humulus lupulus]